MIRTVLLACIGLCAGMLVGVFAANGVWWLALLSLLIGLAWSLIEWRGWGQVAPIGMVSVFILAAVEIIDGLPPFLMAPVAVLALSAWDLSRFRQRLMEAGQEDMRRNAEKHHLRRLLLADAVGLLLAALAMGIQLRIGFYVLLLVGGLVLLALYGMLGLIARPGNSSDAI